MTDVCRRESSAVDKLSPVCPAVPLQGVQSWPQHPRCLTGKAGLPPLPAGSAQEALWWKGLLLTYSPNLAEIVSTIPLDTLLLCLCNQFPSSSQYQSKPVWQHCGHFWPLSHCSSSFGCGILLEPLWADSAWKKEAWTFVRRAELFATLLSAPWKASLPTFAD